MNDLFNMRVRGISLASLLMFSALILQTSWAGQVQAKRKPAKKSVPVLDINQASAEDFGRLPGIGPELARRILDYRQKHGPFRRVEDLLVIRGIGPKKWKALRPYLRIGSATGITPGEAREDRRPKENQKAKIKGQR